MEKFCLKNIYSQLGDEESRFLFGKRLCYSLTGDYSRMVYAINKQFHSNIGFQEIKEELFIFGAGVNGHDVVNAFPKVHWRAFIDNNKAKVGEQDILPIISFQEFIENSKNAKVLISSPMYSDEMKQQLISNGFPDNSIIKSNLGTQYFSLPHFKPQEDEFFIDAGGFDGNSTKDFFKWLLNNNKSEGRSIIFEPNLIQCDVCKENLQTNNKVKIVNKGLWHKKETLKFHKCESSSCIDSDGEEIIETISLDEYLKDEKESVTFIKMDIEGAELNALKGAEQTIKKYKPKLAICIYHKPEDVWEIPNLLLEFVPDYKFYIRHYSFSFLETVLYAVPYDT